MTQKFWLMKSEPSEYSIDDLKRHHVLFWDGVRNYQARNFMRDDMAIGDAVIFYHSNGAPTGPAGIAEVASLPYPDHTQFDPTSKYFDQKSTKEKPTWVMVDVRFVKKFPRIVTREEMKKVRDLDDMWLWKYMRLSITPLTKKEFDTITLLSDNVVPVDHKSTHRHAKH
jgi:predicted RNA-binding protein with PUA-like domain